MKTSSYNSIESKNGASLVNNVTIAANAKDDYKKGDRVRHNQSGRVATIEAVNVRKAFGEYRKVYRLNFGETVLGPFGIELNGGEFLAEALTLYKPEKSQTSEKSETVAPVTDADKSPSWETDLTEDDFRKLTLKYEVADEDRDIIGHRFRHAIGKDGESLEVFISDYAGNERHAMVYSYEEFLDEVRCKVRSLDFLRQFYTEARGWHEVAA